MRASRWVVRSVELMTTALLFASAELRAQSDSLRKQATQPRPFIGRIVGVYDMISGEPIEGVEVLDMMSKTAALTTKTGTLALNFVDSAGSILRIRKVGYEAQLMTVRNLESDPPITVVMNRTGTVLPTVLTTATRHRGPADTVRKLEMVGFYERREKSGAAPMAFVLGEKIKDMSTFDDFQSRTGRPICTSNVWVDGIRVIEVPDTLTIAGRHYKKQNLRKNTADQIVNASEVAAIENYRVGEVPPEYNSTKPAGAQHSCGVTLIWTK